MSEDRFEIIFRGDIVIGHQLADVKARVGRLFKIDPSRVDKLFSGTVVSLKSDLSQAQAGKYKDTLKQAGLIVDAKKLTPADAGDIKAPPPSRLRIAPVGAMLSPVDSTASTSASELDTSHLDLRPQEGNLLDESERKEAVTSDIDPDPDWDIAAIGADLIAASDSLAEVPTVEPPDFGVAPAGEDILDGNEVDKETVTVEVPNIDVLPVGEDLGSSATESEPVKDIDVSHIRLKPRPAEFPLGASD